MPQKREESQINLFSPLILYVLDAFAVPNSVSCLQYLADMEI